MSHYLRTLRRLEKQRNTGPIDLGSGAPALADDIREAISAVPLPEVIPSPPISKEQVAYAALLDELRAATSSSPLPAIVVAKVSGAEGEPAVADRLATAARRLSLRVLSVELALTERGRILRDPAAREANHPDGESGSLGHAPEALRDWLTHASAGYDLVLIEAPPLAGSLDGALLAKAADGLILVAEAQVTTRESLQAVVLRSRAAGCRILGLAMIGSVSPLPRWLSRLVPRRSLGSPSI